MKDSNDKPNRSELLAWWHDVEDPRSNFTYEERMGIKRLVNECTRLQRAEELLAAIKEQGYLTNRHRREVNAFLGESHD